MRAVSSALVVVVSLMFVGNLLAAEDNTRPEGKHPRHPAMDRGDLFGGRMLKGVNLTDEQKAKVEELKKEYAPKSKEAWQKMESIATEEQKKARIEAVKAAKAAGKKGEEVRKDAQAAMKLTDEQKAKMEQARKDAQALRKEVREKILAILTPEQREQLKKDRHDHREREAKAPQCK